MALSSVPMRQRSNCGFTAIESDSGSVSVTVIATTVMIIVGPSLINFISSEKVKAPWSRRLSPNPKYYLVNVDKNSICKPTFNPLNGRHRVLRLLLMTLMLCEERCRLCMAQRLDILSRCSHVLLRKCTILCTASTTICHFSDQQRCTTSGNV